ncbi:MAG: glucohydrolase, partial [Bacilli bacterium]|nr:glucohydrolase [Bacilli bacterium]
DKSAKCLGAILHFMQGTPYIYQGEEIGMTNIIYDDFTDVNDIESKNMIKEKLDLGWSKKRVLEALNAKGRDNARTPFQWNDSLNAGFSTGKPWLKVNPNYRFINAETELQSKDSIFYFYHQLINLRKELTVVSNGSYELLLPDDPRIFAYRRSNSHQCLTLIANMTADETTYPVELALGGELLGNYENRVLGLLKAFEVQVYLKEKLGDKDD